MEVKLRQALPSLFTIGNMALGFFAMLAASDGNFYTAGWLLVAGIICDMLDGRVARLVHGESEFGAEFDSMADFCAFGIAPAYIMYEFSLKDFGGFGYPIAFLFPLCAGLRLARFNLGAMQGESSKDDFEGLPTPAAAGMMASFLLVYTILEQHRPIPMMGFIAAWLPWVYRAMPVAMIVISLLMISKVRYPAMKGGFRLKSVRGIFFVGGFLSFLVLYPQSALFLLGMTYLFYGIARELFRLVRPKR